MIRTSASGGLCSGVIASRLFFATRARTADYESHCHPGCKPGPPDSPAVGADASWTIAFASKPAPTRVLPSPQMQADPPRSPASRLLQPAPTGAALPSRRARPPALGLALHVQSPQVAGDFFAVVVQLFAADGHLDAAGLEAVFDAFEQAPHLGVTLLHRQFEVDHRFTAQAFTQPGFKQCGVARGLFDDVADHPVHWLTRLEREAVRHQMLHQPGVHQAFGHRPVVNCGDEHAASHQLIGPTARRGAQVHTGHVAGQAFVPLITGNEVMPGFFQLEGGAAWRLPGELQAGDAHGPHRRIVRIGQPEKHFAPAFEGEQQARQARVVHQLAGLLQGLAQWRLELAAEGRELFAVIGVDHFQPQAATRYEAGHVLKDHADAVGFGQLHEHATRPLPGENQLAETQAVHQPLGAVGLGADEFGAGGVGLCLCVAGHLKARGVLAKLRADLAFEAGTAMHEKGVHRTVSSRATNRVAAQAVHED
nr:hypothetical protein [Tanacetum cinerariifolium]